MEFDWTEILKGPVEVGSTPKEAERETRRSGGEARGKAPQPQGRPPQVKAGDREVSRAAPAGVAEGPIPDEVAPPLQEKREAPASALVEFEPDAELASPVLTRLGADALQRLRGRYAELLARIAEKVTDPARAEELKSLAERLNPDTWVTDAEVTAGLEDYENVFSALRAVVGRRRKRRKRRAGPSSGPETAEPAQEDSGDGDAPDSGDSEL